MGLIREAWVPAVIAAEAGVVIKGLEKLAQGVTSPTADLQISIEGDRLRIDRNARGENISVLFDASV